MSGITYHIVDILWVQLVEVTHESIMKSYTEQRKEREAQETKKSTLYNFINAVAPNRPVCLGLTALSLTSMVAMAAVNIFK